MLLSYDVRQFADQNLVSWLLAPHSTGLAEILDPLGGACDEAWAYDAWDNGDPWKHWPGNLSDADATMGLRLHVTEPATMTVTGWSAVSRTIELRSGWNLVGYWLRTAQPVAEALASIDRCYTQVRTFDATDLVDHGSSTTSTRRPMSMTRP